VDVWRPAAYQGRVIHLDDWDYPLPLDRIASRPAIQREQARLLVLPVQGGPLQHQAFSDLPDLLRPGDLLVANDTRVMAARLHAHRDTGGKVEIFLLELGPGPVRALARPARKLREGEVLALDGGGTVQVTRKGTAEVVVTLDRPPEEVMAAQGAMPLPPYIRRPADAEDVTRYQTVYAGPLGAAAAPTAGLHFSPALLEQLSQRGVGFATLTLHVGIGTFRPLRAADLERRRLHREPFSIPPETVATLRRTRAEGGRVIAVGTTSARALEAATPAGARVPEAGARETDLFIHPPYTFRALDGLITNFHLPRSSLLMLVAALVGRTRLLDAYREAIASDYRFYSYGDAMLLAPP
jgi:S-adenosylmethionine:tRNA ribosyltransferase-isomerase